MFLDYSVWEQYKDSLQQASLPKELHPVFSVLDNYQRQNEQKHSLSVDDLANLLVPHIAKDKEYYLSLLENLRTLEVSPDTTHSLIKSLIANKQLKDISLAAYDVTQGKESLDKIASMMEQFLQAKDNAVEEEEFEFVTDDLNVLANGAILQPGLRWRCTTLNQMFGSLRKGDFGFIFARAETGKTTFLASETTYMTEQLSSEDGPVIWFNNEEQGSKVKLRCYQASLGLTLPQLLSDLPGNKHAYHQKTKGLHKIFDSATIHRSVVEKVCKQYKPSLVIFDQIDKIQGFVNDREDLRLGAIYIWARELAKEYCPVIAVCQADGTGEGVKWLTMGHVANAKTAKQAEADWILGIGKIPDPGYENVRYLHASKNKLAGDPDTIPDLRHGKKEILIDPSIARYVDI